MNNRDSYIYVAGPYSSMFESIMEYRAEELTDYAAFLCNKNEVVYSPITHGHAMAIKHNLPRDYAYWQRSCEIFVGHCRELHVLCLNGWDTSIGVQAEIEYAESLNIKVRYVNARIYEFYFTRPD